MAIEWKKIFASIGIKEDQLPKDDAADVNYDELGTQLNTALRSAIENDAAFIQKHKDAAYGRATGELQRKLIKKFSLKFENPEDEKDVEKVIDAAHKVAQTNANKTAQQLQEQLAQREEESKGVEDKHKRELDTVRGEVVGMKKRFRLESLIQKELNNLNDPVKLKKKLNGSIEVVLPFMKQALEENYLIQYDDKSDKLTIHPPGQPELVVKDGTKTLGFTEIIGSLAEKNNIVVAAVESKKPFTFTPNGGGNGNENEGVQKVVATSEGLNKIQERAPGKKEN